VVIPVRKEYRNEPIASRELSQAGTLRARRLILKVSTKFLDNLNPMRLRDQINDNFFMTGIDEPVVATVGRSTTNLSLVITTMERYSGSFLLEKEAVWRELIPYTSISHDAEWAKLVVHTVPTKPFFNDEGESLIKSEIETFNPGLRLMRNPIWLSKEEIRAEKLHGSILIHLPNQEMAKIALNSRVIIAGVSCRVEKYIPRHTQCDKCQKFGHTRAYCRNKARCRVCASNHEEKDHMCQICQTRGQECPHSMAKCVNCGKNHRADDKKCQEREKVKPRFIRPTYRARKDSNSIEIEL